MDRVGYLIANDRKVCSQPVCYFSFFTLSFSNRFSVLSYYHFFRLIIRFFAPGVSFFLLLLLSLKGFCQPGAELGVIVGGGYYLGEYNPSDHFSGMQGYLGGFYRYNLNDRFAFRLNAGFSKIDVKDVRLLDNAGEEYAKDFHCSVQDFNGVVEFNFRSFLVRKTNRSSWWSPYIFAGAGILIAEDKSRANIPMGLGIKFNLFGQMSCGIEWSARKTFTDDLDKLSDIWKTGETNFIYNKDWFFVTGITISYRFRKEPPCYQF